MAPGGVSSSTAEEVGILDPLIGKEDAECISEHKHYSQRNPWLRAFVLGALDGLVSKRMHHR
jgi:hypothetical protein